MNTKKIRISLWVFLALFGLGNVVAQTGKSVTPFTEKVNMNNVGNKNDTYYLLLCQLQSRTATEISGTLTIETTTQEFYSIEVHYSDNNRNDINIIVVQYGGKEYIAIELLDIMNIVDISFTGYATNRSLLVVNESEVEVISDTRSRSTLESELSISDTRTVDDLPNFAPKIFRLDFKQRSTIGVPGSGTYSTSMTISPWWDASGGNVHQLNFNNGGIYYRTGVFNSSWNNWGKLVVEDGNGDIKTSRYTIVPANIPSIGHNIINGNFTYDQKMIGHHSLGWYVDSWNSGDATLWMSAWGGIKFFTGSTPRLSITQLGNVGIGTTSPAHKLDVAGNIRATGTVRANEVIVTSGGADFVFSPSYPLRPLSEVEQFITANKHLPDIAPADTMIQNGVNMGEFQIQLLQKIEELTLYVIELKKEIEELKKQGE